MLTLFIWIVLGLAIYGGARRGLVLQVIYTVGYMISFMVAQSYYQTLAPKLEMFVPYPSATQSSKMVFFNQTISLDLDHAFYAAIAFCLILFAGWLVTRFIGIFFNSLTYFPILRQINWLGGGLVSFIVAYAGLFLFLYILSMVPLDFVQDLFRSSSLARFMVEHTPLLSDKVQDLWVTQILK
ncbi:CvpA family protein [Enterococcus nangangensis]|uniref:CvpA family protein n=1 Tax=Enterococcus nangangensis TaxID=2559926 RepID=UPI0010F901CA|nr:CvpA family protein [Enterococcus nangangensis]